MKSDKKLFITERYIEKSVLFVKGKSWSNSSESAGQVLWNLGIPSLLL